MFACYYRLFWKSKIVVFLEGHLQKEGELGLLLSLAGKVIGMPMQPVRLRWCCLVCTGSHFLHGMGYW